MKRNLTLAAAVATALLLSPVVHATELELAGEDDLLLVPGSVQQQGQVFTARVESRGVGFDYVINQATGVASWSSPQGSGSMPLGGLVGQTGLVPQKFVDFDGNERVEWAVLPIVGITLCMLNHQAQVQSFMAQCFASGGLPDVTDSGICGYGASFKCLMPCTASGTSSPGENCDQSGSL